MELSNGALRLSELLVIRLGPLTFVYCPYGEQHFSFYDFTGPNSSPVASMTELSQYLIDITHTHYII